jgi:hypothetical protein
MVCRHVLIRAVMDLIARELLPITRPKDAKRAISVVHQQRPCIVARGRIGRTGRAGRIGRIGRIGRNAHLQVLPEQAKIFGLLAALTRERLRLRSMLDCRALRTDK